MPTYDYHCHANGRVVEVRHRMSEQVGTWGELCALAGIALDG
ncbi:MAG: regulator, partial [Gammaproteobacteria bacterium]